MLGKVKWWNDSKGYGFIKTEDKDVFIHYTQIIDNGFKTLSEGQEVEFDLYETEKGFEAKGLKRCE